MSAPSHYAILTAMLAPAFFLTATASLLLSANNRLARIIDRARSLLIEYPLALQRQRSLIILRAGQLLYVAISFFVGTSLTVAADSFLNYRLGLFPTLLAALGVLAMLAASILLSRESTLAVTAINEEMDHRHVKRKPAA